MYERGLELDPNHAGLLLAMGPRPSVTFPLPSADRFPAAAFTPPAAKSLLFHHIQSHDRLGSPPSELRHFRYCASGAGFPSLIVTLLLRATSRAVRLPSARSCASGVWAMHHMSPQCVFRSAPDGEV